MAPRQRERIVDTALSIADEVGWDRVRLHDVAVRLGIPLARIHEHFPDLDAVAEAWLARADRAMLEVAERADLAELAPPERIHACLVAWFAALGNRRRVLRRVIAYKLTPAHLHLQAAAVVATSRRVQWLREAAMLDATGFRKSVEETGLTALFLATLTVWLRDDTPEFRRTRDTLRDRLGFADRLMACLFRQDRPEQGVG